MSFLLDIINGLNKFLGYLDISPKYLNRAYTILSIFPTLYILRIVSGMFQNGNHMQGLIYLVIFLVLVYFLFLNILYHFLGKNTKWDITQLFVKYLPEDAFNIQQEKEKKASTLHGLDMEEVVVQFDPNYQVFLATAIQELISQKKIQVADFSGTAGYSIKEHTLFPYYFVREVSKNFYELQIGTSYEQLKKVGEIHTTSALKPIGLYILGGDFMKEGVRYHEPYRLKLLAKKSSTSTEKASRTTRSQRRKR